MGFHKPLIRPAISGGGVALGGGPARIPMSKGLQFIFTHSIRICLVKGGWDEYPTIRELIDPGTLLGGSSQDLDTWLITLIYKPFRPFGFNNPT